MYLKSKKLLFAGSEDTSIQMPGMFLPLLVLVHVFQFPRHMFKFFYKLTHQTLLLLVDGAGWTEV